MSYYYPYYPYRYHPYDLASPPPSPLKGPSDALVSPQISPPPEPPLKPHSGDPASKQKSPLKAPLEDLELRLKSQPRLP